MHDRRSLIYDYSIERPYIPPKGFIHCIDNSSKSAIIDLEPLFHCSLEEATTIRDNEPCTRRPKMRNVLSFALGCVLMPIQTSKALLRRILRVPAVLTLEDIKASQAPERV